MTIRDATSYDSALDNRGLEQLRRELHKPTAKSIHEVAKQFEALFVQSMLKSMRAATPGDSLFGGHGLRQYRSLLDQQLALNVSQGQGVGLAAILERQLMIQSGLNKDAAPVKMEHSLAAYPRSVHSPSTGSTEQTASAAKGRVQSWETPQDFARAIWPAAQRTAQSLGIPPEALVAQAALETGWGQHVLQQANGRSSYNLFNIKAHGDWTGATVRVPTVEYRDGIAVRKTADFRAYGSVAESFADYANYLRSHPRYAQALNCNGDAAAFLGALQDAGYATDPNYAGKIQQILDSDSLSPEAIGFKKTGAGTNT